MQLPCQISIFCDSLLNQKLEVQGEHTAESHVQDKISKFLSVEQTAALEQMLLLHPARRINSGWPLLAGFDSSFGISSKKFEFFNH